MRRSLPCERREGVRHRNRTYLGTPANNSVILYHILLFLLFLLPLTYTDVHTPCPTVRGNPLRWRPPCEAARAKLCSHTHPTDSGFFVPASVPVTHGGR